MKAVAGVSLTSMIDPKAMASLTAKANDIANALFEGGRPEVMALVETVMRECVLRNIMNPQGAEFKPHLQNHWIIPGGPDSHYRGQWTWDTQFVTDLLGLVPDRMMPTGIPKDTKRIIREIYQNYWDWQDWWIDNKPEELGDFANDMIVGVIKSERQPQRTFSQIPIIAWGLERTYNRTGDKELLKQSLSRLERLHDWWWRERDLHNNGLIALGAYSGVKQHAKWETFDLEVNMDGLKMTKHPTRKGANEGNWYSDVCTPGNNAYLIHGERSLQRLAEVMGDGEMAQRRKLRIEHGIKGMRKHMWDEEAGTFLSVHRDTLEKIPVATISSWIPLYAGVATPAMAARMAKVLASPSWMTKLPLPTVDAKDRRYVSDGFWRGDTWPPTSYQIAHGLAAYGFKDLAADICDKNIENAMINGINEKYDSATGEAKGVKDYSMSATLLTMMLDGLTKKNTISLKA